MTEKQAQKAQNLLGAEYATAPAIYKILKEGLFVIGHPADTTKVLMVKSKTRTDKKARKSRAFFISILLHV